MVMGIMLLVVVVLLITWVSLRSSRWKIVLTATGPNAEELEAKYEHLKSNNITCVLETDAGPAIGSGFMPAEPLLNAASSVVKLKVDKAQVEQAKELLEEFQEAI